MQLHVPKPCHENWDAMSPVEKGRFCNACAKEVVDFTGMSDQQVLAYFKKPSTGSVCGRFSNDQLDRDLQVGRKRIPWLKYFFQVSIPLMLASCKFGAAKGKITTEQLIPANKTVESESFMQGAVISPTDMIDVTDVTFDKDTLIEWETETMGLPELSPIQIHANPVVARDSLVVDTAATAPSLQTLASLLGQVSDSSGQGIPFATIEVMNLHQTLACDSTGHFQIRGFSPDGNYQIRASSVGFEERVLDLSGNTLTDRGLHIILRARSVLPEAVVVAYGTTTGRVVTGMVCNREEEIHEMDKPVLPESIRAYPNPAIAGQAVTIESIGNGKGLFLVELYSLSGQLVYRTEIRMQEEKWTWLMPIPLLKPGAYIIRLTSKESKQPWSTRLIINE